MPARRPWTADEQRKLDNLLEAGKTVVEIAAHAHVNLRAVAAPWDKEGQPDDGCSAARY
jgi:hypothetical protein